ncbi:hypothetical protein [Mycobacterium sp. 852002-51057_SCH5723018]|uniref:hypothetical protein n=1 Tax=Mycobacterium sp. 852002-51057_SCH5723018 TaxID=1834094 RepID=UPI0012E859F6|nr:hypothetical protein [Mycobacterium sp. 852002-51057_SCH5723018]
MRLNNRFELNGDMSRADFPANYTPASMKPRLIGAWQSGSRPTIVSKVRWGHRLKIVDAAQPGTDERAAIATLRRAGSHFRVGPLLFG